MLICLCILLVLIRYCDLYKDKEVSVTKKMLLIQAGNMQGAPFLDPSAPSGKNVAAWMAACKPLVEPRIK